MRDFLTHNRIWIAALIVVTAVATGAYLLWFLPSEEPFTCTLGPLY